MVLDELYHDFAELHRIDARHLQCPFVSSPKMLGSCKFSKGPHIEIMKPSITTTLWALISFLTSLGAFLDNSLRSAFVSFRFRR